MMQIRCPRCGAVPVGNGWCEACQRRVMPAPVTRFEQRSTGRGPRRWLVKRRYLHATAALMSLVVPGAGQVYKGRVVAGVLWFLVVVASYLAVGAPAMMVHLMCVVTAGSAARVLRRPFQDRGLGWGQR